MFMRDTRGTLGKFEELSVVDRRRLLRIVQDAERSLYRPRFFSARRRRPSSGRASWA
jgi:hypothetical protein